MTGLSFQDVSVNAEVVANARQAKGLGVDASGSPENFAASFSNLQARGTTPKTVKATGVTARRAIDLDGDGTSDLAWHRPDGLVAAWFMASGAIRSAEVVGTADPGWTLLDASGDYNGDGKTDLLWRDGLGEVFVWTMNGSVRTASNSIAMAPLSYQVVSGAADFNGDGKSDILWRGPSGQVIVWLMDGIHLSAENVVANVGLGWQIESTAGDYDADGRSDIVWRGPAGEIGVWLMNGTTLRAGGMVLTLDRQWELADGSGDYDGDGKSDLLWRNLVTGDVGMWMMNGTVIASASYVVKAVPTTWRIAGGAGDFDGDGRSDVLWRRDDGSVGLWQMIGPTLVRGVALLQVPIQWNLVRAGISPPVAALPGVVSPAAVLVPVSTQSPPPAPTPAVPARDASPTSPLVKFLSTGLGTPVISTDGIHCGYASARATTAGFGFPSVTTFVVTELHVCGTGAGPTYAERRSTISWQLDPSGNTMTGYTSSLTDTATAVTTGSAVVKEGMLPALFWGPFSDVVAGANDGLRYSTLFAHAGAHVGADAYDGGRGCASFSFDWVRHDVTFCANPLRITYDSLYGATPLILVARQTGQMPQKPLVDFLSTPSGRMQVRTADNAYCGEAWELADPQTPLSAWSGEMIGALTNTGFHLSYGPCSTPANRTGQASGYLQWATTPDGVTPHMTGYSGPTTAFVTKETALPAQFYGPIVVSNDPADVGYTTIYSHAGQLVRATVHANGQKCATFESQATRERLHVCRDPTYVEVGWPYATRTQSDPPLLVFR
jgi:hypothetical protein